MEDSVELESVAGENPALMQLARQQGEDARERTEKHWQAVKEKQTLCRNLQKQLQKLRQDLRALQQHEAQVGEMFRTALESLQSQLQRCTRDLKEVEDGNRTKGGKVMVNEAVSKARKAKDQAQAAYHRMRGDQTKLHGASTPEGSRWQDAKAAVRDKKEVVQKHEQQLEAARRPPLPVMQPLPDSRSDNEDMLAVLFFLRGDLAGSMPLLQQLCCAAQLALCPWPVIDTERSLWDATIALESSPVTGKRWQTYFKEKVKVCKYVSRSADVVPVDQQCGIHVYTRFDEPDRSHVRVHLPSISLADHLGLIYLFYVGTRSVFGFVVHVTRI